MRKLIFLLIVISALSVGVAWVAEEPGKVLISWGHWRLEASVLTLLAAVAFFSAACMAAYSIIGAVFATPKRWARARGAKRQTLGIEALTQTFAAIAAQDMRGAKKSLKKAEHLMPEQPLTLMLASQVARMEGNVKQSQMYLERMSKAGATEFLALRGLIENARRAGDVDVALRHAEKAYALKPHDRWLAETLMHIYASQDRTEDALKLLARAAHKRVFHANEVHQIRAALLCEHAKALTAKQQYDQALESLKRALRRHPKFVPAMMQQFEIFMTKDQLSSALNVANDGWKRIPHPDLGDALLRCFEGSKHKAKAAKLLQKLAKYHADSDEAQILMAGLALRQKDYRSSRNIVKKLMDQSGETSRLCRLMANIEHAEENHDQEALWMRRASESPAGNIWGCNACGRPAAKWEFACPQCSTVGSLV